MRDAVAQLRDAGPVVRLLVLTQRAFNLGFYLVLPYLSVHLTDDLGLGAALVGLVLGLRAFSQQGLFVVGGLLADRWGTKPVVLTGCAVRVAGFLGLAVADRAWQVLVATLLVGVAAALFSPAVEAALAQETREAPGGLDRVSAFALFSVSGEVGAFAGPLLGALLLLVDFRLACVAAAGAFVVVLTAHARLLPRRPGEHAAEPPLAGWREVVGDRLFLLFAVAMSGRLVAYNQLYLLLPLQVDRTWGSPAPLAWLFALSALLVVAGQLPLTRRLRSRPDGPVLTAGFALTTGGFLLVALVLGAAGGDGPSGWTGLLPLVAFVVLLTVGQMVLLPHTRALLPRLARERRLGTHYGVLSSVSGLAVLLGSTGLGLVVQGAAPAVAWVVAGLLPAAGLLAAARVLRALDARELPRPSRQSTSAE